MAQLVKNLPAMQETKGQSLGHEDPLGKGRAIHSSILAWRIPGTGEPGGGQSMGSHRVGHDQSDLAAAAAAGLLFNSSFLFFTHFLGDHSLPDFENHLNSDHNKMSVCSLKDK